MDERQHVRHVGVAVAFQQRVPHFLLNLAPRSGGGNGNGNGSGGGSGGGKRRAGGGGGGL